MPGLTQGVNSWAADAYNAGIGQGAEASGQMSGLTNSEMFDRGQALQQGIGGFVDSMGRSTAGMFVPNRPVGPVNNRANAGHTGLQQLLLMLARG